MDPLDSGVRVPPSKILLTFLKLGCTSFGGPIAHLGYFRNEFVERRHWLTEETFAEIVGLCQMLPGPASSQVGFTIGLRAGRWPGALAAWAGFTLPSAMLMFAFALGQKWFAGTIAMAVIHGLQLAAVAVVAQAVLAMRRALAPDAIRATIAVAAAAIVLLAPVPAIQLAAIASGAVAGLLFCRVTTQEDLRPLPSIAAVPGGTTGPLLLFCLLFVLPLFFPGTALFSAFYRSGALVFGGGHVVLPLLESATVARGWIDQQTFLAGYGFAQVIPGPLFTFSAFLGALVRPAPTPATGAAIALLAIFLPGLLLVAAVLPTWNRIRQIPSIRWVLAGVNASVVGILIAALYRPVWTTTVRTPIDFVIALSAFLLLVAWKLPPWSVVLLAGLSSAALHLPPA